MAEPIDAQDEPEGRRPGRSPAAGRRGLLRRRRPGGGLSGGDRRPGHGRRAVAAPGPGRGRLSGPVRLSPAAAGAGLAARRPGSKPWPSPRRAVRGRPAHGRQRRLARLAGRGPQAGTDQRRRGAVRGPEGSRAGRRRPRRTCRWAVGPWRASASRLDDRRLLVRLAEPAAPRAEPAVSAAPQTAPRAPVVRDQRQARSLGRGRALRRRPAGRPGPVRVRSSWGPTRRWRR